VPKLADKLIGTSVGGEIENITYNFTLQELLELFLPIIPANNLQGVLDYGNTATQDINLFGTITTTNLDVTDTANLFITYLNEETHIVGSVFDSVDSVGTAGQVLTSTGDGVEWFTLPPIFTPNLQQVLEVGNTANIDILLDANIEALDVSADTATVGVNLTIGGTITDNNSAVGSSGQVLSSTVTGVSWISLPVYSATSPLLFNPATGVFSIQVANGTQGGYLTANDWITFNGKQDAGNYITALTGEATASGPGSAAVTLSNAAVTGKVLTGLNVTGGNVVATDSILTAFGKVQNQINGLVGGVQYQGVWNADTNTPTLISSVGTQGHYYIVNVAGTTNLNGITDWQVGDWAIFSGGAWQKVDNTDSVTSVNGFTGAVSLTTDNIPEGTTNLYYLDSRARAALSFVAGSGAYNNTTGVITIPTDNNQILNGAGYITLSSISATSPLAYNNLTGVFSIQQADATHNGYLSSTDWSTFNGKQNYLGGTGLVKSTAGTITYITDNSGNWNTAYNRSIISAAVTGTTTKTLTLNEQDGNTITASWTDLDTGLTSVGVSMPSAFSVANSPLTANGTIAVTGAGTTLQYIDGTGALRTFPGLTGYVPYTGATTNVDLGEFGISAGYFQADLTPTGALQVGRMQWNSTDGTMDLRLLGNNVTLQIGQENVTRVVNKSGIDLLEANYQVVRIRKVAEGGAQGQRLAVVLAQGNNENNSTEVIGLVTETINVNQEGFVTSFGEVKSINTTGNLQGETWVDGDILYLSSTVAGQLTNVRPVAPNHSVIVGYVVYAHANNGKIYMAIDTGYELGELHNVYAPSPTANQSIYWDTTNSRYQLNTIGGILGYTPANAATTLTINGTTYDLSANRTWSVGTVTSVAALTLGTSGTDLSSTVANSTTTPVITLNVPTASAANRGALSAADWSTFNTKVGGVTATTPLFSSGGSTPNITIQQSSGSQAGFLSAADWTTFNNKQASGNYITSLTGEATATGPGAAAVTLNNASVTGKVLTGVNITGGTVLSTDTMLTAFGKLQNQINGLIGGSIYQGTWNAATNTPTLTSGVGVQGYYYIVSVAGTTNLDGITDWFVGDWAIFNGGVWQQVDNTDAVVSVNGQTGAVSLTTDNIPEGTTNLYYTNTRARAALSFVAGSGAYNSTTGVITIPTNNNQITNGANYITLASLSGTAPISYNSGTGAISITQAGTASNGYLSSTDWNTFNNKQSALTNPVTGTGSAGQVAYWSSASAITGENSFYWDATNDRLGIGLSVPLAALHISVSSPFIYLDDTTTTGTLNRLAMKFGDVSTNQTLTFAFDNISGTANKDVLSINELGRVGVNTTAPGTRFEVVGANQDSSQDIVSIIGGNASNQTKGLYFNLQGSTPLWTIRTGAVGTDAGIRIAPDNTNGMTIAYGSNGNATFTGYGAFAGVVYANSRLMVGTNTTDQTYASLFIAGDLTTGVNQYAIITDPRLSGDNSYALFANPRIKESTAVSNTFAVYIPTAEKLSGATIVNSYGLYIANQVSGSSQNYAIYSAGGLNYFGSNATFAASVGIGAAPTKRLYVYDATSGGTDDIAMIYQGLETNHAWYRSQRINGANMVIGATRNNSDGSVPLNSSIVWNQTNNDMAFGTNNLLRFTLTSGGTFNYTASVTATSNISRGLHIQPTLVAAANGDSLVGLDIRPTFDLGPYGTIKRIPFRATLADNRWIEYNENIFKVKFNDNTNVTPLILENAYGLGFAVGILFNLGYDGTGASEGTAIAGGRLFVSPNQSWTSTASTQDADMLFQTASNGVLGTRFSILSGGTIRLDAYSDNGFVKTSASTGTITIDTTSYQPSLTLTTTGTSGAATLVGSTLNIPQYQSVLTNPVTGTGNGVAGQVAYFTGANSIDGTSAFNWSSPLFSVGLSAASNQTDYKILVQRHGTLGNPGTWTDSNGLQVVDYAADGPSSGFIATGLVSIELPRIATTDTYAGNAVAFRIATDNLTVMAAKGNGNVHIGQSGATDNGERLQVLGNVSSKSSGNYGGFIADNSSSGTVGGGYFIARSFGTTRGLFGIAGSVSGTEDNNLALFAEGGTGMGSIKFMVNGSATPAFIMTSTGRFGVNESGPSSRMQVNGDIRIAGAGSAIDGYSGGFLDFSSDTFIIRGQATTGGGISLRTSANGAANVATERVYISPAGNTTVSGYLAVTGVTYANSRLMVGTATGDQNYASIFVGGDITAGANQYAILIDPQLSGTTASYALFANARIKANTAVTNAFGVYIPSPEKLSGATISESYALYIANQTSGSSVNYSIYSSGGLNYLGGNLSIATTQSTNAPLQIRNSSVSSGGSAIWAYGFDGAANFYTTRGESPFNATIYLYNNPVSGPGYGSGISFRAKSDTTDGRGQGNIYTSWTTATDASRTAQMVFTTTNGGSDTAKMWLAGNGYLGVGQSGPLGTLHVTSTGITAAAPSPSWPSYNSETGSTVRSIYVDTGGNNNVSTAGYGATVAIQLGSYWDSRVLITPTGNGGSSPADQGTGRGKDLMLKAGTSDNGAGYKGGRLYLNGGMGYSGGYSANGGDIIMQFLTGSGTVCIGVDTPYGSNLLNVNGSIYSTGNMAAVVASNTDLFTFVSTNASYTKSCFVGSVAVAGSTSSYYFYGQQSTSVVALKIFTNGNIQNTNNSYGAISDARLKENIKDATPKLEDLMKVKVRNYNLKGESNKQLGVISQELEEIFPNMIEESTNIGESMKIKGVKYSVFVPMLIKAIQEQQAQINELKSQLNK
jgi:predicted heme/steroid binding protein